MIISDDTSVILAVEPFLTGFIEPQEIADTSRSREVIVGLSAEGREQVPSSPLRRSPPAARRWAEDQGLMYMRGFRDLDGHQWSFIHMDMSALPEG
jgi:predicted lactoylglutathione lyase